MLPKASKIPSKDLKNLKHKKPHLYYSKDYLKFFYYKGLSSLIPKFAVIVPKRLVPKATLRNLVKRQANFVIMQNKGNLPLGYYVFILKKPVVGLSKRKLYEKISSEIIEILSKIPKY